MSEIEKLIEEARELAAWVRGENVTPAVGISSTLDRLADVLSRLSAQETEHIIRVHPNMVWMDDGKGDKSWKQHANELESRLSAQEWSEEDQKLRNAVTILLQVALDELLHVVEAVDHQHETGRAHLKYTTPWHAVTSARKVREDLLAQAAMWGVVISPTREPRDTLPRLSAQGGGGGLGVGSERANAQDVGGDG